VLATQLGQVVGDCDAAPEVLREYGIELGISIRLAEEIVGLTVGDEMHPGRQGEDLRRGIYPLPLLYSIEAEPVVSQLLARHMAEGKSPQHLIAAVRESGGIARAVAECESRVRAATALAEAIPGAPGAALAVIASIPADFIARWAGGGSAAADRPAAVDLPA
jgi:geranylgeranyl pyrophosphate synthase